MTTVHFACCDERRRAAILGHPTLNGIDELEVGDLVRADLDDVEGAEYDALSPGQGAHLLWQRRLTLRFINPLTAQQKTALNPDQIRVEGGARVTHLQLAPIDQQADAVVLRSSAAGDFSRYTLRLVRSTTDARPPEGIDPVLGAIAFSYKVDCPSDFDCRSGHVCLREPPAEPVLAYLAKDYASFRRLILDRMTLLAPDWRERNPADLGIALVELLAYAGDQLSYEQDAVATEAYVGTARRRTSVRRHARLVDYAMHDGCNARAWLQILVNADTVLDPAAFQCFAGGSELPDVIAPASPEDEAAHGAGVQWFEVVGPDPRIDAPIDPITLRSDHAELPFYTWGDGRCCLPLGSTKATLRGHFPGLAVGQVLILEEERGPVTGDPADADATHRQAVRLTAVRAEEGAAPLVDPLNETQITEIEWAAGDALRWPLWVQAEDPAGATIEDVSVAHGNIVLVDHGLRIESEDLGVARRRTWPPVSGAADHCEGTDSSCIPQTVGPRTRFRPTLDAGPLTMTAVVRVVERDATGRHIAWRRLDAVGPASAAIPETPARTRPALTLTSTLEGSSRNWTPAADLLGSDGGDLAVVAEAELAGWTTLRFGDNEHGRCPEPGEAFIATYRIGNGRSGNVGPESIRHVVTTDGRITGVRNPLAAAGGIDPETIAEAKRRAPQAFQTQLRAVTPADYEALLARQPSVQRAAARLRWTGSWHTHFLAVDQLAGERLSEARETTLREAVEPFRLAGHDVEFDDPVYVSLEFELEVCVADDFFRSDVEARLLDVLSDRRLPDGRLGMFHPDRLSFGQTFYMSPVLAAVHLVAGVASASFSRFGRQGSLDGAAIASGRIELRQTEIARLENDPNWPEHGVLRLKMLGGK
jgi:hypothetical protein